MAINLSLSSEQAALLAPLLQQICQDTRSVNVGIPSTAKPVPTRDGPFERTPTRAVRGSHGSSRRVSESDRDDFSPPLLDSRLRFASPESRLGMSFSATTSDFVTDAETSSDIFTKEELLSKKRKNSPSTQAQRFMAVS